MATARARRIDRSGARSKKRGTPAKAGVSCEQGQDSLKEIPAFAGMTESE
jgi:hypothetical protein